ncbi:MAG: UDP-4-amino-4,6-dideoxy-N-acetyl-beta-L-altrosami ne transaminase [Saprospiraceae bacterium]|nr:MAG: UDP-4-amino-4,6-dideoxy-N-acetyl-beta-L-altrosami ne transaminase [Saprospiraceae bacterium]
MKIIPYGRQSIDQEDINAINEVLVSDYLTQGPLVEKFESDFAAYIGCKHAVAVSNGTAALHLSALALGVQKGDRVITSPITFSASANCVEYCGGEIDFCDIDPQTYLIDLDKLATMIESKPKGYYKGIIPVDFCGLSVDLERISNIARQHNLWIIEDACHAPGAKFQDTSGNWHMAGDGHYSDCSIFSFHPVKHIACGEGGMVTTNNDEIAERIRLLRTHGISKDPKQLDKHDGGWYYQMLELGYNYRLTDFQSALGVTQLKKLDSSLEKRNEIARIYDSSFKGLGFKKQFIPENYFHAYHLYVIEVPQRKALYDHLRLHGIYAQVHYIPVHTMPYYSAKGWKEGDAPNAEKYYTQCLSIPMFPTLDREDQAFIIDRIKSFYA